MRCIVMAGLLSLLFAGCASAQKREHKVLILGLDGVYPPALERANTPAIDALIASGCYTNKAMTGDVTVSGPGWSSILCGVWRDKHDVPDNDFLHPKYDTFPSVFTLMKRARPNLKGAAFNSWEPLHKYTIFDDVVEHKVFNDYDSGGDFVNVNSAATYLKDADVDLVFFYFADIDTAGHTHGFHPDVPEYIAEIEQVDGQIAQLMAALRARPTYEDEDWLIISTTDHGGTLDGSHGRDEPKHREIYFLVSGDNTARGFMGGAVNQVDVIPTALHHLGIEIEREWNLDGRIVGRPHETLFSTNLVFNGDAEYQRGYQNHEKNAGVAGWHDLGNVTVLAYGSPDGYPGAGSPGPENRGDNFFAGGAEGDSTMSQRIDLSDIATRIDTGEVRYDFSAWLGGYAEQRDMATLTVRFIGEHEHELGSVTLDPVTLEDRRAAFAHAEDLTGFLSRQASGDVPTGTRIVEIILVAEVAEGANDGYADNISFRLR